MRTTVLEEETTHTTRREADFSESKNQISRGNMNAGERGEF